MPAPKGNQNAKGNRGGGRKSAYQELADAEELHRLYREDIDIEKLQRRIKSGKFSVKDIMLLKALGGSERIISEMFKKIYPDLEKVEHSGGLNIKVIDYEKNTGAKKPKK